MPVRSPSNSERAARAARSISVGSASSASPAGRAGWRDRADVKATAPWRHASSSRVSPALRRRRTAIAERTFEHRIGAPHMAGAVGYAALQIRLRCNAEMELFCSGAAVRPPAGIVGQFEQRLAALGGIERWLLLMCPLRAPASARDVRPFRIQCRRRCAPLLLRSLSRHRIGETQAKHLAEDRRPRHAAETDADGRGGFSVSPQPPQQVDALGAPCLALHACPFSAEFPCPAATVVCALPVSRERHRRHCL
jgi:hypothetical protein